MPAFVIVWLGQVISLLGTNMTTFGLTIWAYKVTGSATALSLVAFFYVAPQVALSPFAGALVDRSNRKLMMVISDLAAGLASLVILALFVTGRLQVWHLYITSAFAGAFQAFQWPAFSAAITLMVPKEHYGRTSGMMSLADSSSGIFAPLLAGALLTFIGLGGLLAIDIASFIFAILAVLVVHIPQPKTSAAGLEGRGSLLKESVYGFRYILSRPSLLGLQLVFMSGNLIISIAFTLMAPMILAHTSFNQLIYGSVTSIGAVGGLLGGLLMSAWGGPKPRVHGVLMGWALSGLLGTFLMGLGASPLVWGSASFIGSFLGPIINGSNQAIWQSKVAPDVQGRVFSVRMLIAWITIPVATLIAGPLADFIMEPAMQGGGPMAGIFGPLVGTDPGSGMSLVFVFAGLAVTLVGLAGYAIPAIRNAETILPDHDEEPALVGAESPA
jgi:MFS family permease